MNLSIPEPVSGGLILSYKCNSKCIHCMYACGPEWEANWISEDQLAIILDNLSNRIQPSPYGKNSIAPNHGLHITGGEPFLNFDLLAKSIEMASNRGIPSLFVETNCSWCSDKQTTRRKLEKLKSKGMDGIMISVNPFYLEFTPFTKTELCIQVSREVFGRNVMVYQQGYYKRFKELGIKDTVDFEDYIKMEKSKRVLNNVEFFMMGRSPYEIPDKLDIFSKQPAQFYFNKRCSPSFGRKWHNHFDNYGNYVPGYCGGISFGKIKNLEELLVNGINTKEYPILAFLLQDDFMGLYEFAEDYGFQGNENGYYSKCHLCMELRKFLNKKDDFRELSPEEFYHHL